MDALHLLRQPQEQRYPIIYRGARIAQWLECRTRDRKVAGSSPGRAAFFFFFFFSSVNFWGWLLFRNPFHPRVTAEASKISRSFCQRCGLQVTAMTHTHTIYAVSNEVTLYTGAWLYGVHKTCGETATVSRGISHVATERRCKIYHSGGYQKTRYKRLQSLRHSESHTTWPHWVSSTAVNNIFKKRRKKRKKNNSNQIKFIINQYTKHKKGKFPFDTWAQDSRRYI